MSDVDPQSNSDLVARLRAGDLGAFDDVHRQFHGRLYGFLARLARSRDVAEDLLEETWLRLVAHARQLSPDTQLGPWLFTVARNLHVSYRRSRALEMGHLDDVLGLWPAGVSGPSPFEATAASEMERKLEAALASLPATYREVLLLVGVEGLQPAEVAQILGQKPDAVRQRLARARAQLAGALGEHAPAAWRQP